MRDLADFALAEVLALIPRNNRNKLRITREHHRGHSFVSLREWFVSRDGELRPGKMGMTIQPDELDDVIASLQAARLKCTGRGSL